MSKFHTSSARRHRTQKLVAPQHPVNRWPDVARLFESLAEKCAQTDGAVGLSDEWGRLIANFARQLAACWATGRLTEYGPDDANLRDLWTEFLNADVQIRGRAGASLLPEIEGGLEIPLAPDEPLEREGRRVWADMGGLAAYGIVTTAVAGLAHLHPDDFHHLDPADAMPIPFRLMEHLQPEAGVRVILDGIRQSPPMILPGIERSARVLALAATILGREWERETATTLPPLSENERRVFDLLSGLDDGEALTGAQIIDRLANDGWPVEQSTLTRHIIPTLKRWGVQNRSRVGYFVARG
jgi:hypothetical protein